METHKIRKKYENNNNLNNIEIVNGNVVSGEGPISLIRPMLSAVGSHLGPSRGYSHPFAGPQAPPLLPPNNLSALPPALAAMSTEFARPHPKPRYNSNGGGGGVSNQMRNNGSKYSEQNCPVNLAVGSSSSSNTSSLTHSPKDDRLDHQQQQQLQQQQQSQPVQQTKSDVLSSSASNLFSPSRLSYGNTPTIGNNAYQGIDFQALYGRTGALYG